MTDTAVGIRFEIGGAGQAEADIRRVAELQQLILQIGRLDQEKRTRDALNETVKVATKVQEGLYTAAERNVQQAVDRARQLEDEKRATEIAARTNVTLAVALDEVAIARLKERLEAAAMAGDGRMVELLNREIAARERIRDLILAKDTSDAQKKGAEDASKSWQKAADDIEKALTDALVRGFESGKGLVRSVGDYIVNFFKTTIARGIAQALIGSIGAGISGLANAAGFGGGGAGGMGGGSGIGSTLFSLLGGSTLLSFGATGLMSTLTGVGLGTSMSAAGSLIAGGNISGGLGIGLGAAAPYILGAYALYRIISGVGTGRDRGPAFQAIGSVDGLGNDLGDGTFGSVIRNPDRGAGIPLLNSVRVLASTVADTARALGGTANTALRYTLYQSVSPDNRGGQVVGQVLGADGRSLFYMDRQVGNDQVQQTLQGYVPRMVLAGLQASNLPQRIGEYLRAIDASTASEDQINKAIQTALAVKGMTDAVASAGGVFARMADLSVEAREELANLTGGIDQFVQKVSGFVQDYYSESERVGITARQVQATLRAAGISGDFSTREQFRAALEGVDLSSEAGRKQLAALLNAASSFASISEYLKANNLTLGGAAALSPAGALADAISASSSDTAAQTATLNESLVSINTTLTSKLEEQLKTMQKQHEEVVVSFSTLAANTRETYMKLEEILINGIPQAT